MKVASTLAGIFALCAFSVSGADLDPPFIQSVFPSVGGTVSNLTQVTVVFNESVTGVEVEDFLINGTPATGRSGASTAWTFTFNQPSPGPIQFGWDASHAIYDLSGNRFDQLGAGATWALTLADTIPPTMLVRSPTPGAVVAALTQIEVTFREPVTGVNAADLLINSQAASSVSGGGAGPYLFGFTQPLSGTVTVSWASGHGIVDTAAAPNAFAGGSWTYNLNPAFTADIVLNEIMADNLNGLVDENGDTSDWIELYNRGATSVNLVGWSLTDDPTQSGQWVFPAITLNAGQYLLVFASGKDRATTGPLTNHTSFTLAASEYLGLYNAQFPRQVASEFAPVYPEQRGDISWGRTAANTLAYFATATPRATNSASANYSGFATRPEASINSGLFNQPFSLSLSCETPGASIYYTVNGDIPNPTNGTLYAGAIAMAGNANKAVIPLRAAAFKTGLLPSTVLTRTYIFPEYVIYQPIRPAGFPTNWISDYPNAMADTVADYEMDPQILTNGSNAQIVRQALSEIPTVSLVTTIDTAFAPTNGVYSGRRKQGNQRPVNAEMILPDGTRLFQADCGFEIQGGTSPQDAGGDWKDKKLSMRLLFQGDFGTPKLEARVFEDTPIDEFDTLILDGGLNWWWTHMTDGTQRDRAKFITDTITSDLMNRAGMPAQHARYVHLYLNGLYWGLYFIHERMDESAAASYFGGQKEEWDVIKHTGDAAGLQNGSLTNYQAMLNVARSGVANNLVYEQLQGFLDVPWLADYMIVNFWVGNDDWPHHNWYAWRRSRIPGSAPWRFLSWDAEHTFKAYNFGVFGNANLNTGNSPGELFRLLTNNIEFRVLFGDRAHRLMFNGGPLYTTPDTAALWSSNNPSVNLPATAYRKRVDEIWNSIVCESARWGDVATANINSPYTRELHYTRELNAVFNITNVGGAVNYFPLRGSNVLAQFRTAGLYPSVAAPRFSRHGGNVPAGYSLYITNVGGAGTVYYTTNGADPRVYGSGAVSSQAAAYSGTPIAIGNTTIVLARTLNGTNWSALNEATFSVAELIAPIRITELMYNPQGGDAFEFVELQNIGATPFDLAGYYFEGITFTFPPPSIIPAGARIVLASAQNPQQFATRYPGVSVFGYYSLQLANGGERLALLTPDNRYVVTVDYDDEGGWPTEPDGLGPSLEIIDVRGNPDDPANWRASGAANGTPGLANSVPPTSAVVLNEVHAIDGGGDWIEIRNMSGAPADLAGWSLSDDGSARKFVFPGGTSIPTGEYLIVYCDTNSTPPGLHSGFALSANSGSVFMYNAATSRVDAISYGKQVAGYSVGRTVLGWELMTPTSGGANGPAVPFGPQSGVTINEWLADPSSGNDDWIELHNTSASLPVALGGAYVGNSNLLVQLPPLTFLAARGFIQLFADETPGADHLDFRLAGSGGAIVLHDSAGLEINRVNYGLQTETVSQGRLPDGTANIASFPGTASPGASNYVSTYTGPYLNEVLARNQAALRAPWGNYADWIEIYNPNVSSASLAGVSLTDSLDEPFKWTFPSGTTIAGNGYLLVWCDVSQPPSTATESNMNAGFNLSGDSGGVYLINNVGQALDLVEYGPQVTDLTIGKSTGQWRLLASPTPRATNSAVATLGNATGLRLNEWMADPSDSDDWFELFNTNAQPVSLTGVYLTDDLSIAGQRQFLVGALSFIGARDFAVFEADGNPENGRHHVNFSLNASGEAIRIYSSTLGLIDTAYFGSQTKGVSGGRFPDGQAIVVRFPNSATPGASNYRPHPAVAINEVLTHTDTPLEDAVELRNLSAQNVDIGGWYLSDNASNLRKFRFPPGTIVTGDQFRVFYESQFNGGAGSLVPFTFDSVRGDSIYLSEADASDNLTGYRSQFTFGAAENGVSFGRFTTSLGHELVAQSGRTLGANNVYPRMGPVVINEIMYHPLSVLGTNDNSDDEYIEMYNLTTNTVPLYDPLHATNTWQLRGGVEFVFPSGVTLASRAYLLVVNFNPADTAALDAFRLRFGIPNTVAVYGPYEGKLDNAGESVELYKPDRPETSGLDAGYVPYVMVERIVYDDGDPWPAEADGTGPSLQRRRPFQFGNEPLNWKAAIRTPGRANVADSGYADADADGMSDNWENEYDFESANAADADADADGDGNTNYQEFLDGTDPRSAASAVLAPVILTQPQDQEVSGGLNATFTVTASGSPLNYRWFFNDIELAGQTNTSLAIQSAQTSDTGFYAVQVFNVAGLTLSRSARLTVNIPPRITQQPQSARVGVGSNVMFTVVALFTGTVHYQWQSNGVDIAGATADSLTLTNLQLEQSGDFRVIVTDDIATIASDIATLTVLLRPQITVHPLGLTVPIGGTASFTSAGRGTLPMTFRWRRNNVFLPEAAFIVNGGTNTFTITNAQPADAMIYNVFLTNTAGVSLNPTFSSNAYLIVVTPPTNQAVAAGTDATFQTTAAGRTEVRYQWQFNGNPLLDQTNAILTLSNVQPAQAGTYSVFVAPFTNATILPNTFSATLTVEGGAVVTLSQPELLSDGTFRMLVTGASTATYPLETSSNLIDWIAFDSVTMTNTTTRYIDIHATNAPRRFYRARNP